MRNVLSLTLCLLIGGFATTASADQYVGELLAVEDVSADVKFQDHDHVGHHSRGRALVVADFDNDGRDDVFLGNPGDESIVLRNVDLGDGDYVFELAQIVFDQDDALLAWGATAADYDNDGDIDLFVSAGGNECQQFDHLLRNELIPTGELTFRDLSVIGILPEEARLRGRVLPAGNVAAVASGNAVWADYDGDGWLDLFVNANTVFQCGGANQGDGANVLWHNDGITQVNGRDVILFSDATEASGLGEYDRASRHSFFFDYDNDGDLDLYEMNFRDDNVLWQNQLSQTGSADFIDVSEAMALTGDDIRYPQNAFAACPGDFNNDGWEDMIVFMRGNEPLDGEPEPQRDCAYDTIAVDVAPAPQTPLTPPVDPFGNPPAHVESPFGDGHALFINQQGQGFANEALDRGLNSPYIERLGVMGTQLGDLNGDGLLDIYIGNGGQPSGEHDQFLMSDPAMDVGNPQYLDVSHLVRFEAEPPPDGPEGPRFPYRTHGTAIADIDRDGMTELLVLNGGPEAQPNWVREPNRLFEMVLDEPYNFLRVRLEGDGVEVNRSAVGARVAVTASKAGAEPWTVYRTLYSSSCFSASNGYELFFGVRNAEEIDRVEVTWPDGTVTTETEVVLNSTVTLRR